MDDNVHNEVKDSTEVSKDNHKMEQYLRNIFPWKIPDSKHKIRPLLDKENKHKERHWSSSSSRGAMLFYPKNHLYLSVQLINPNPGECIQQGIGNKHYRQRYCSEDQGGEFCLHTVEKATETNGLWFILITNTKISSTSKSLKEWIYANK